jgi:hypothetical protein
MIHFNFVVSDAEAERIFDCVTEEIDKYENEILNIQWGYKNPLPQHAVETISELQEQVNFLQALKSKMLNTKE